MKSVWIGMNKLHKRTSLILEEVIFFAWAKSEFLQLYFLDPTWPGYMRGSKTDCGGRWYSFHRMIPFDEDMQYIVVDVSSHLRFTAIRLLLILRYYP